MQNHSNQTPRVDAIKGWVDLAPQNIVYANTRYKADVSEQTIHIFFNAFVQRY